MTTQRTIAVIGLGYVGLPVAMAFGERYCTIAYDVSLSRISELKQGFDRTGEVLKQALVQSKVVFTNDIDFLRKADFYIVAVPTPIDESKQPVLQILLEASRSVGRVLKAGDIVVYESTVYPGVTEEECVPMLEDASGLKSNRDFSVGYSPERINPGDSEHGFTEITKVVAAQNQAALSIITEVYGSVVKAGVFAAASIKVAEAAKVIENTQRDLNIALVNELALIFNRLGIDSQDVLAAARTKWNFMHFSPGLVGGHCIGVDPYYLTYKALKVGYTPEVILAGRRINDRMGEFIVQHAVKRLTELGQHLEDTRVTVLGLTFKDNVPDLRNSRVVDIIEGLRSYGLQVQVHDPMITDHQAQSELGVSLTSWTDLRPAHCVVIAVAHERYRSGGWKTIKDLLTTDPCLVVDVKGCLDRENIPENVTLWRL